MKNSERKKQKFDIKKIFIGICLICVAVFGWNFYNQSYQDEDVSSVADEYMLTGNFQKAIVEYKKLIDELSKNSSEEDLKYLKLQLAKCYAALGYYKEALPIFRALKDWYPQELISAYLDLQRYEEAKNILTSDKVLASIKEGDDIDGVRLHYELLKYYKAMGRYGSAVLPFSEDAPTFETELFSNLNLADLYYRTNDLKKFEKEYEHFNSLEDVDSYKLRMKLSYAQLLALNGDKKHAKKIFSEVKNMRADYYKYSPEVICSDYYEAISLDKSVQKAQKAFEKLKLDDDSLFKNDIKYFCKVNMQY